MADKKLATLQDEIKLLKGEVKQSLASVRDYLLNMELPSAEISTILQALGGDGEQKMSIRGSFEMPTEKRPEESYSQFEDDTPNTPRKTPAEEEEMSPQDDIFTTEETTSEDTDETTSSTENVPQPAEVTTEEPASYEEEILPEEDIPSPYPDEDILPEEDDEFDDEEPEPLPETGPDTDEGEPLAMENYRASESDILSAVPKVNLMANLINWISRAIRDIGYDQLPVFLEVYGVSGHLSPEMKDVILHLAELTNNREEAQTSAGLWSEQMLSLHGILTGGEPPVHPVIPSWGAPSDITDQIADTEIMDEEPAEEPGETPVKLKFVLPDGNGDSREFSIDLAPGTLVNPSPKKNTEK